MLELGSKYITEYLGTSCNKGSVVIWKFQSDVTTCTEMLEVVWTIVLLINEDFIPCITCQRYNTGSQHTGVKLTNEAQY